MVRLPTRIRELPAPAPTMGRMLRVALRPRSLGILAAMVIAAVVCSLLAQWQWDRAHRAITSQVQGPQELGEIHDVLDVGDVVTNRMAGNLIEATGTFAPQEQILVGGRSIDGTDAAIVVTALHVPQEDGTQARLPVARGWLPAADVTGADGQLDPSLAPAPPAGEVTVDGHIEASEAASDGIVDGVSDEIATTLLVNEWGSPMYAGFLGQTSPAEGLDPMPEAESQFSTGLNWQNIGYSLQWVLFAGFFLFLWWRSVRQTYLDELAAHRETLEAQLASAQPAQPAEPTDPTDPQEDADAGTPSAR